MEDRIEEVFASEITRADFIARGPNIRSRKRSP